MEYLLGQDWEITPAGGATGKAYIAKHQDEQQLFLKRNSSPFLAVLSAEGIVPKLVWTKRVENGDVITAQHWLQGRELRPEEMATGRVARLMSKIHSSQPLLSMLEKLDKEKVDPYTSMRHLEQQLDAEVMMHEDVHSALEFLYEYLQEVRHGEYVVCHGDINHNNWLLSDEDELYLIDWDGAMIADPAMDLGMLLYKYVEAGDWEEWLAQYGLAFTPHLHLRMKWYAIVQVLASIQWDKDTGRLHEMNKGLRELAQILGR
ncbi:phosphotransferase family protein [Bacillus thermotolerans]|uniref:Aminoglycoside phosphotransferase family protein n=1 Tax=Bacillus thermotolerans TaxID=1221996 RepID=A0A0F5ID88_BACTR|nr:phosphotransferase family protein [Bacillus thermotolerans]KKB39350.1 aminoglycoside phosphotransferase family protein [Bacillus thermotolerans]KKB43519.1 aminoglycoside phosphotransferase family protein [Bacillus thermotolerans]